MRTTNGRVFTALALAVLLAGCGEPKLEYKGLSLVRPPVPAVRASDVERFIDSLRNQVARSTPLPPGVGAQNGDRVVIDFAGTIDGTPFEGGTAAYYSLVLGGGQMIAGFEGAITGMKPGQTKDAPITFPADYTDPVLAGRTATFRITLREAFNLQRPPANDDLARMISGGQIGTLAGLRRALRGQMEQDRLRQVEQGLKLQAVGQLMDQWKWRPSNRAVNKEVDRLVQAQVQATVQRGGRPDAATGQAEALRPVLRTAATRNLVFTRVAKSIAKREKITVTDMELEQVARQMAASQGRDPEAVMKQLTESDQTDDLRKRILEDKVLALIIDNAKIGDVPRIKEPTARTTPGAD